MFPPTDQHSAELLARWQSGDELAAAEIFDRYVARLVALARSRISAQLKKRFDPEDVVQSAYRSFFRRSRLGDFELRRSGDLWRLLAAITVRKTLGQVEHHRAARRDAMHDASFASKAGTSLEQLVEPPRETQGVVLLEIVEALMQSLDPLERRVMELRLQETSTEDIAAEVARSPRTVRRILERLHAELAQRLQNDGPN